MELAQIEECKLSETELTAALQRLLDLFALLRDVLTEEELAYLAVLARSVPADGKPKIGNAGGT